MLEHLVTRWPVAVEELSVVAHSMGGLLIRSAHHAATQEKLALAGHAEEHRVSRHTAPGRTAGTGRELGRCHSGQHALHRPVRHGSVTLRSAGITDLRYGICSTEDWQGRDRFEHAPDTPRSRASARRRRLFRRGRDDGIGTRFSGEPSDRRRPGPGCQRTWPPRRGTARPRFPPRQRVIEYGMNHLGSAEQP